MVLRGGFAAEDPKVKCRRATQPSGQGAATGNPSPALPFSIKVTEEKIDKLPEYMSDRNPVDMDYPYCPVMIDGEFWVMYKNGYNAPVFRYKGTNIENAVRQADGKGDLPFRAYILGGVWYDAARRNSMLAASLRNSRFSSHRLARDPSGEQHRQGADLEIRRGDHHRE